MSIAEDFAWDEWGESLRSVKGLYMVAALLPNGSVVKPLLMHGILIQAKEVTELLSSVSETFTVLREQEQSCWKARWMYKKGILHAIQLADLTIVVAMSAPEDQFDWPRFEQMLWDIKDAFDADLSGSDTAQEKSAPPQSSSPPQSSNPTSASV
jgi:hypothetical protein